MQQRQPGVRHSYDSSANLVPEAAWLRDAVVTFCEDDYLQQAAPAQLLDLAANPQDPQKLNCA